MRKRLLSIVLLLGISGCAGVPTTSSVHYTGQSSDLGSSQFIRVIAHPPVDGMSPVAVASGFLDACADPTNNYQVAREYLTDKTASTWDPTTGTRVFDGASLQLDSQGQTATIKADLVGTVTAAGRYSLTDKPRSLNEKFVFAKNRTGQWRITQLPDGLMLAQSELERSYRSWAVYFIDASRSRMIADSVVLPVAAKGVATMLVQALLTAPSSNLTTGIQSGFPTGTKLTFGSVPVVSGVAQVDLSADVLAADRSARRALAAQLAWTLQQLPSVSSVRLTVSGQQLTVPGIGAVTDITDWSSYAPTILSPANAVFVASHNEVDRIDSVSSTSVASLAPDLPGTISAMAVDPVSGRVAATLSDGALVTNAGPSTTLALHMQGSSLSRPSWDREGNVLVADYGRGIWSVPLAGKRKSVTLARNALGNAGAVRQVAVASDGVRVALIMSTGTSDVVAVGILISTKSGIVIDGVHRVDRAIVTARDVVWTSPLTIAVIGSRGAGPQLLTINIATSAVTGSNVPAGTQSVVIDSSGNPYVAVAGNDHGNIVKRGYGRWTTISEGVAVGLGP